MAYPPGAPFLQSLSALMNLTPAQYQMTPMGGIIPMVNMAGVGGPQAMGVTVPTGVASISAPPMRKVTQDAPSLLGAYPGAPQFDAGFNALQQKGRKPQGGPSITVFVGNITERASDMLIRQLLSKCGVVINWKRVQGANGKLQAFGFCEYADPESAMRSIRLLHDFEIVDRKLVVKVDAKTKEKLDEYVKSRNPRSKGWDSVDTLDEDAKREDSAVTVQLQGILKEHEIELSRSPDPSRDRLRRYYNDKRGGEPPKAENLSELDMEEEKRSLIHREIDKFRDTYKKQELEKAAKESSKNERESEIDRRRENDKLPDDKRVREKYAKEKESENDRVRESRRLRTRDRTPVKDKAPSRRDREHWADSRNEERNASERNNLEDDEDNYERRRQERKLREKEASYQERLRNWEAREARKVKEYNKLVLKEQMRKEEESKEAKRLKQFLEDYDDDRDDLKYYKGNALARRLRDRNREIEEDERDRRQEKKELQELRRKLTDEGHPDPDSEAKKRLQSSEPDRDKLVNSKIRDLMSEARLKSGVNKFNDEDISLSGLSDGISGSPKEEIHVKAFSFTGMKISNPSSGQNVAQANSPDNATLRDSKKKKFSVQDVFNANDEEDNQLAGKRRKLQSLIDENTDSNQSVTSNSAKGNSNDAKSMSSEEKRKQIKTLIEKIPTSKEELFKYEIDWALVDNTLMEKRIRPWINKKITEYIGEEEQALLDFICTKLQGKSSAQSILDDVAMVLDEEAEVFVVKMWRLLIYEIEAKKLGIGKV